MMINAFIVHVDFRRRSAKDFPRRGQELVAFGFFV